MTNDGADDIIYLYFLTGTEIKMNIRNAKIEELSALMQIYDDARAFMRASGNSEQWAGGYPSEGVIISDIEAGNSYVCEENGEILGVFCYFFGNDPTYEKIYGGAWLNAEPYGVIHRIAVAKSAHGRGVAKKCFDFAFDRAKNVKIDTHRDNIPMQRSLEKNGFARCGIIYLESGDERIAFQKASDYKNAQK